MRAARPTRVDLARLQGLRLGATRAALISQR
jgi:hypothetical protein